MNNLKDDIFSEFLKDLYLSDIFSEFSELNKCVFSCDILNFDTSDFDDNFCLELFNREINWELEWIKYM